MRRPLCWFEKSPPATLAALDESIDADAVVVGGRFGEATGETLMRSAYAGVRKIRDNVERYHLSCDFIEADALYVADGWLLVSEVKKEHEVRRRLSLPSRYYDQGQLPQGLGTKVASPGGLLMD